MPSKSAARSISGKPKFSTEKTFPCEEQRNLFKELFLENPRGYIYKPVGENGSWRTAKAENGSYWKLQPSEAFKAIACLHPRFYIGTRPGKKTWFAVIDIDKLSRYHNKKSLQEIRKVLIDAGLRNHALYRSSDSGGWYLYIFFQEPVSTSQLRVALVQLLTASGYVIKNGELEVFPNPGKEGTDGFGLRLPLQPGFAWLNCETAEVLEERDGLSPGEALHRFILDFYDGHEYETYRQLLRYVANLQETKREIQTAIKQSFDNVIPLRPTHVANAKDEDLATVIEVFGYVPPGMIVSAWVRGRNFSYTGLTDFGQRHEASKDRHHYYFYGDPTLNIPALGYNYKRERQMLVAADMERLHNGFSQEINRGSQIPWSDIANMADWEPAWRKKQLSDRTLAPTNKHHLPPLVLALANVKRSSAARQRIAAAVEQLQKEGIFLSRDTIAAAAKCSPNTAKKHADLWKHLQTKQWNDRLAMGSGDLKGVVAEGEPQKAHPQANTFLEMPPGRLAARQVVYEWNMRSARTKQLKLNLEIQKRESVKNSWSEEIEKHLPESIRTADTVYLQFLQAMYGVSLATSPDYESQKWLEGIREEIRLELQERWTPPEAVPMQNPDAGCVYLHRLELDTG